MLDTHTEPFIAIFGNVSILIVSIKHIFSSVLWTDYSINQTNSNIHTPPMRSISFGNRGLNGFMELNWIGYIMQWTISLSSKIQMNFQATEWTKKKICRTETSHDINVQPSHSHKSIKSIPILWEKFSFSFTCTSISIPLNGCIAHNTFRAISTECPSISLHFLFLSLSSSSANERTNERTNDKKKTHINKRDSLLVFWAFPFWQIENRRHASK